MKTKTRPQNSSTRRGSSGSSDPTTAYARDVVDGRLIAGPHVRAASRRHLLDLETGSERGLTWRPDLAARVIRYFRTVLRLAGGEHEGQPFIVEPWQAFVLGSIFGWIGEDGYRRFQTAFVETGKGSGKSPLAAGIGLYMLHADREPRAEVYAAATKKDQAMVLFRDAVAMVKQSAHLRANMVLSGVNPVWQISHLPSGSWFKPISSDEGQSGPRVSCGLIDEIHEHKDDTAVEMMRAALKGRRGPLIFGITNSGTDRKSVCRTMHDYGVKVAAGDLIDDAHFAYICALDEGEDPFTDPINPALGCPRSWHKANPSLGVTIQIKYLEGQVREARGMPSKESKVRRLNFCEWVDAANPWISGDAWRSCERDRIEAPPAESAFVAIDLAQKHDMVAAARAWPPDEQGVVRAELRYWTPADTMEEREKRDRAPYSAWARAGHILAVPRKSIDEGFVVESLKDWLLPSVSLAFDPWRFDDFQRAMDAVGIDNWTWDPPNAREGAGIRLVRHGQGWAGGMVDLDKDGKPLPRRTLWMPQSIGDLEELVINGKLHVARNPCLTWNSASAILIEDQNGNRKWDKRKSTGRIDGIVALSMVVGLALQPAPKKTKYTIHFLGGG